MSNFFHLAVGNALLVTLLCLPAWLIARTFRRPALCHAVWLLVLLKLVCPPLWEISLPGGRAVETPDHAAVTKSELQPAQAESTHAAPTVAPSTDFGVTYVVVAEEVPELEPVIEAQAKPLPFAWRWPRVPSAAVFGLLSLWLLGTVGWLVLAIARAWKFDRLVQRAAPASDELIATGTQLAAKFGLEQAPPIVVMSARISPLLWATWRRPQIVLPRELLERLSPAQQSTIVAHELAHLARGDHRLRWLETLVLAAYWWLPAAWWVRRRLSEAEEQCCDALVVARLPERARAYAGALLETVEFLADPPVALPALASGLGTAFPLKRRFEMILKARQAAAAPALARRIALAAALAALPLSPLGVRAWADEAGEQSVNVAVTTEVSSDAATTLDPAKPDLSGLAIDLSAPITVGVATTAADPTKPDDDVAARISKLEQTLTTLAIELQSLKAARGLPGEAGQVQEFVIERDTPEGKQVEHKVIRVDGKTVTVAGRPTLTLRAATVDGKGIVILDDVARVTSDKPGKKALSRRTIEFRTEGGTRGEVLRKERAALEQRLREISEEEKGLGEVKPDGKGFETKLDGKLGELKLDGKSFETKEDGKLGEVKLDGKGFVEQLDEARLEDLKPVEASAERQ